MANKVIKSKKLNKKSITTESRPRKLVSRKKRTTSVKRPKLSKGCYNYEIQVGAEYQCQIPDVIDVSKVTNEPEPLNDELVWDPTRLPEEVVDDYLERINCKSGTDEGLALWRLQNCKYDVEKTIRTYYDSFLDLFIFDSLWSPLEKDSFEKNLEIYGKDFCEIQKNIVTKSINEVVGYYYARKMIVRRQNAVNGD